MGKDKTLRDRSGEELKGLSAELQRELFQLRNEQRAGGKVEQSHLFRQKRRERARVLTLIQEKS